MSDRRLHTIWWRAIPASVCLALLFGCSDSRRGPAPEASLQGSAELASPAGRAAPVNSAPAIRDVRLEPADPVAGETVTASVAVADLDGDEVELGYTWRLKGEVLPAEGGRKLVVPVSAEKGQSLEVEVVATDGKSTGAPATARVRVGNRPPEWKALRIEPSGEVQGGVNVAATPLAEDPDGDAVSYEYRWFVDGRPNDAEGDVLATKGLRRGAEIRVEVSASDGVRSTPPHVSETVRVANGVPEIVSTPPRRFQDGVYRYTVKAEDPDGDRPLRLWLAKGPAGMELDPLGELVWRPDVSQVGTHVIEIAVSDRHGGEGTQRFELVVDASGDPRTGG